ncbi:MAG: inorganic diphosphatase [Bacilli bacterium]
MSLVTNPTFPGCIIECRVIGLLRMTDEFGQDDKLLAVPARDPRFSHVWALKDIPGHNLKEIAHFFEVYKNLEDKLVTVRGWEEADYARTILRESEVRWKMAGH